jgi:hypothetical protein
MNALMLLLQKFGKNDNIDYEKPYEL